MRDDFSVMCPFFNSRAVEEKVGRADGGAAIAASREDLRRVDPAAFRVPEIDELDGGRRSGNEDRRERAIFADEGSGAGKPNEVAAGVDQQRYSLRRGSEAKRNFVATVGVREERICGGWSCKVEEGAFLRGFKMASSGDGS